MFIQDIIIKKRNNESLSKEEINFFVQSVKDGVACDSQIGAFTMAICINSMNDDEIKNLTFAMRDSGDVLKWQLDGPIVDKHSTGGVGDKISLMLAPMMASIGAFVPMIAGRGLGHTGGTLDKLDAIPGYNTTPTNQVFEKTVKEVGCAIIGQTGQLAPADKKMYAIRDVSGTVESVPLITASILSKKLAAGLDCLVMDVKCGNGAFMKTQEDAQKLAQSIVRVGNLAQTKTDAIVTDMDSVLGRNVGNALEVVEAVEYLKGVNIDPRMHSINMELCVRLAEMAGLDATQLHANLQNGKALEFFGKMVAALGGPVDFVEKYDAYLPKAKIIKPLYAHKDGFVTKMNAREIGMLLIKLKGGRLTPEDKLDYATGFSEFCQIGDLLNKNKPICYVHAQTNEEYESISKEMEKLITIE